MRKFRAVFKEKQSLSDGLHEKKVLGSFQKVYSALLEKYNISNFNSLDEKYHGVFLAELNSYWDEKAGILSRGKKFLGGNSDILNEKSTSKQKKYYMKKRAVPAISETFRQSGLKWKLYNIIDEMYKGIGADDLSEVLTSREMTDIMVESFRESVKGFMTEVKYELTENSKTQKKTQNLKLNENKIDKPKRSKITNEGFFRKNPIDKKISSEAKTTAIFLLDLLAKEGVKITIDADGYVKDPGGEIIAGITPKGYVDVSGFGNWAPEELEMESHDITSSIIANMQALDY